MSTRAVAREFNVIFSTIIHVQRHYWEFCSMTTCMLSCGRVVCWCQRCEQSAQWWRWSYGMCRHKLQTTSTIPCYRWPFECTETPLSWHSSAAISSSLSMITHGPMSQISVHNSWKLKMSQFLHGLHNHQTCHTLSMFGMLWINVYNSVVQFQPISRNFDKTLKRNETTFRTQSTFWSTLSEGDVSLHSRYWFSDPHPYLFF